MNTRAMYIFADGAEEFGKSHEQWRGVHNQVAVLRGDRRGLRQESGICSAAGADFVNANGRSSDPDSSRVSSAGAGSLHGPGPVPGAANAQEEEESGDLVLQELRQEEKTLVGELPEKEAEGELRRQNHSLPRKRKKGPQEELEGDGRAAQGDGRVHRKLERQSRVCAHGFGRRQETRRRQLLLFGLFRFRILRFRLKKKLLC